MKIIDIDYDQLIEIRADYMDYFNHEEDATWNEEKLKRRFRQLTERFDYIGLGLYDKDKLLGFCIGALAQFDDGLIALVNEIFIGKNSQSKGYGSKLLKAFEEKAKALGAFRIQLEAANDDIHHRFYNLHHDYKDAKTNVLKSKAL